MGSIAGSSAFPVNPVGLDVLVAPRLIPGGVAARGSILRSREVGEATGSWMQRQATCRMPSVFLHMMFTPLYDVVMTSPPPMFYVEIHSYYTIIIGHIGFNSKHQN